MCLSSRQALSGPRSIWNHVQAQRNASEVPEWAVFLRGDRFRGVGRPLSPPCPNRSRWRCGVLPKQEALGEAAARASVEAGRVAKVGRGDRKSTRLNSSHLGISYAVFCLKKKK